MSADSLPTNLSSCRSVLKEVRQILKVPELGSITNYARDIMAENERLKKELEDYRAQKSAQVPIERSFPNG